MNCEDSKQLISEYIDGAKNTELEAHLAKCDVCRKYYEDLTRTVKLCNSVSPTPLPDDFKERLNKKLKSIDIIPWYKNKKMYAGIAGLAACLLIVTGPIYSVYEKSSQPFESNTPETKTFGIPDTSAEPQIANIVQADSTPPAADVQETETYAPIVTEQPVKKSVATPQTYTEPQDTSAEPIYETQEEAATDNLAPVVSDMSSSDEVKKETRLQEQASSDVIPDESTEESASLPAVAAFTEPVTKAKISGGGSSARNMPAVSEEAKTIVICYSLSAKSWFDENITPAEILDADGITVYKITESDLEHLNEFCEITGYTESALSEGIYITFN